MKKILAIILTLCIAIGMGGCKNDEPVNQQVMIPEYEDNCHIELFGDISRHAEDAESVQQYFDAGFTCWVMTEDDALLTDENGQITEQYMDNIEHVSQFGEVWVRNHYNYANCWNNPEVTSIERWGEVYTIPQRNITDEFSKVGNVTGYLQWDEPSYDAIGEMSPLVDWHNAYAKDKVFHVNLFPSYGSKNFSGHSFEEYVQHYVDTILAKVEAPKNLGLDNYPLLSSNDKNVLRQTYLSDLLTIANVAKEYNARPDKTSEIKVGYCIQSFRDVALRDVECKEDISFQVNTCLAMGAKYLEYYLYCTIGEQVGMLDAGDQKRPVYDYVKEVNEELQKWDHVIMSFDWQGVVTVDGKDEHENQTTFDRLESMELKELQKIEKLESRVDTLVGEFVDENGNYGYMTVNYTEPTAYKINYVTYTFKEEVKKALVYQDGESKVYDIGENHELRIRIPAGGGAFVIPCQ